MVLVGLYEKKKQELQTKRWKNIQKQQANKLIPADAGRLRHAVKMPQKA